MEKREPLFNGNYYHIYNRGNNGIDIFLETENYYHFLHLYAKYINPIAETFAWCLLKNHFHILVRIKENEEITESDLSYSTTEKPKTISPSRQFSHLFNSYTQAINKKYHRTGSLFEKNFERKLVTSEKYFQQLIFYIHNNPVHHGITEQIKLWHYSSYSAFFSSAPSRIMRPEVIGLFGNINAFKKFHQQLDNINQTIDYCLIDI